MAKVTIYTYSLFDEEPADALVYEGNVEVGMNQGNALVVTEQVPDLTGKAPHKMKVIALINSGSWSHAEVE